MNFKPPTFATSDLGDGSAGCSTRFPKLPLSIPAACNDRAEMVAAYRFFGDE